MKVSELLREAFLRGEEVVASRFGRENGVDRKSVWRVLRSLGPIVECQAAANGTAQVWKCVDMGGMCRWQPPKAGRPKKRARPASLEAAWGMRSADIDLPVTKHEMRGAWQ